MAHETLQVLVLLRVHVLGGLEFVFGALEGGFNGVDVDLFLGDRVLGEHADLVAVNLGKTAANRKQLRGVALVTRSSPCSIWVTSGM